MNAPTRKLPLKPGKPKSSAAVKQATPDSKLVMDMVGDTYAVISTMRNGIPARSISDTAARLGVSQERLFESLRLPKSTLKGRISKNALLSSAEQDRIYRAERVWARAVDVLEDEAAARSWINRENRTLGGEAPLALLDTEVGYELVLDTLGRIEYGVVS